MHGFLLHSYIPNLYFFFSLPHTYIEKVRESEQRKNSFFFFFTLSLLVVSTYKIRTASLSKHQYSPMDQEAQRHSCRLCSKSFPCGRSLGGHMRSHMSYSSSTSFAEESKLGCGAAAGNGYGLRENPKKTWRISCDDDDEEEKQCRECGKEFQSWRALFGHMSCHSSPHDDKREVEEEDEEEEEEEEEGSWSGGGAADGEGFVKFPKKKRRTRRPAAIVGSSSSASEEQEDVAISLMMLSRDAGCWGSDPAESSDKNSEILEEDRDRNEFKKPNSYKYGEFYYDSDEESKKGSNCVKKRRRRRTRLDVGTVRDGDGYGARSGKSRYECATCKKSFDSYQALGGHRASHKRLKGGCCGGGESTASFDADAPASVDPTAVHVGKAKAGNHQCGVCGKVFASGQALGGHKRSHLAMSSPLIVIEESHEEAEALVVMPGLLDLNLPAPVADDDSWWAGSNRKREAMVGLIANR